MQYKQNIMYIIKSQQEIKDNKSMHNIRARGVQ